MAGQPLRPSQLPWLRDLYQLDAREAWVMKASQVFISEWMLSVGLWAADQRLGGRGNALYVFPAAEQVSDFVRARVDSAIDQSPHLVEAVGRGAPGGVGDVDNVGLKRIGRGHVYFRGSRTRQQILSVDGDALLLDEVDEFAGGTVDIARKRLNSALEPIIRGGSTPKFPASGIAAIFANTTRRHYLIRCAGCGERQALSFPDSLTREGRLVCVSCGGAMRPDAEGEWVAEEPDASIEGFHVNRLYSPRTDLVELARLGYRILDGLESNPDTVQEFFNQDLGLPHAPEGGQLSDDVLLGCEGSYQHPTAAGPWPVTMGVDVGAVLHVWIEGPAPEGENRRRLLRAATTPDWADLDRYMTQYGVGHCVIDANPDGHRAAAFASRWPGKVHVCFYPNMKDWRHKEFYDVKNSERVVLAHRTRSLDAHFDRFYQGAVELPQNGRYIPGLYDQMKAPVRVVEKDQDGQQVARYQEGGSADHYAHAGNYANLARHLVARRPEAPQEYGLSLGARTGAAMRPQDREARLLGRVGVNPFAKEEA